MHTNLPDWFHSSISRFAVFVVVVVVVVVVVFVCSPLSVTTLSNNLLSAHLGVVPPLLFFSSTSFSNGPPTNAGPFLMQWDDIEKRQDGRGGSWGSGGDGRVKVGERIEVRDNGAEWRSGTVMRLEEHGVDRPLGVYVAKDGSDEAFLWDEWRKPPQIQQVEAPQAKLYDLVAGSDIPPDIFDESGKVLNESETEIKFRIINPAKSREEQELKAGTRVTKKNEKGELEFEVQETQPLPIGTRIERRNKEGTWIFLGVVHRAHINHDPAWKSSLPDAVIDMR